jgi:ferredoxin
MKRFRFDLDRCTGCGACVVACANENGLPPGGSWREVVSFNERRHPRLAAFHLSLACTRAMRKRALWWRAWNAASGAAIARGLARTMRRGSTPPRVSCASAISAQRASMRDDCQRA